MEKEVVRRLGNAKVLPVTYAGGIHSMEDIDWIEKAGNGFVDYTDRKCFGLIWRNDFL